MTIKIPEGDECIGCLFIKPTEWYTYQCVLFSQLISANYFKCQQCLNKEPIEVIYE